MLIRLHLAALCVAALAAHAGAQAPGTSVPWTDMGGGLAGAAGIPSLQGTGALSPGTPGSLKIVGAAHSAPCLFYFSLLEVDVPFKGGTLSAFPPIGTYLFVTNPTGGLLLPWGSWTGTLPAGLELYFQVAVADSGALKGVAISNLLLGITQP
jgi:hypothetical protein